jgi:hypothetical protein
MVFIGFLKVDDKRLSLTLINEFLSGSTVSSFPISERKQSEMYFDKIFY